MRTRVCFTALWLLSSAVANADAFHVSESFKLPKADRRVVAEIAWVKAYGVRVEEISGAYSHNGRYAMARCKPHDFVDKLPIQYEVSCAREGTAWTCSAGHSYLRARIGRRELRLVAPRGILREALGVARHLVESGRFESSQEHNQRDLVAVKPRHFVHIHVEPAGENTFKVFDSPHWIHFLAVSSHGRTTYREIPGP